MVVDVCASLRHNNAKEPTTTKTIKIEMCTYTNAQKNGKKKLKSSLWITHIGCESELSG